MRKWLYLTGAIVTEVTAALSLKGAIENAWLAVLVVGGYVAAFTLLARCLGAGMPLGVAYGIWGASGVVLTALFSFLVFGEPLGGLMIAGIIVVVLGVFCVDLGAQHAERGRGRAL